MPETTVTLNPSTNGSLPPVQNSPSVPSPSAQVIQSATMPQQVTDARGRVLTIKRLTALDKLRLFKAAGPVNAKNEPYLGMAALVASVTAIDGAPFPQALSERMIEGNIAELGDDGIEAVANALSGADVTDQQSVYEQAKN